MNETNFNLAIRLAFRVALIFFSFLYGNILHLLFLKTMKNHVPFALTIPFFAFTFVNTIINSHTIIILYMTVPIHIWTLIFRCNEEEEVEERKRSGACMSLAL